MEKNKRQIRTRKGLKEYSYLGCPLTRNRSAWCFRMCLPDAEGHGRCGRIAPHSLKSGIQKAIETHNRKLSARRFRKLEQTYLTSPEHQLRDPGIRISEGEADIVLPLRDADKHPTSGVLDAVCFKLLNDVALNAVCSLVESGTVLTADFSVTLTHASAAGELIARGRYVGRAGNNFLADAMLTDTEGRELGRGKGVFFAAGSEISGPATTHTSRTGT